MDLTPSSLPPCPSFVLLPLVSHLLLQSCGCFYSSVQNMSLGQFKCSCSNGPRTLFFLFFCAFEFGTRTKTSRARSCRVLSFLTLHVLSFFSVFPPLPRFFNISLCKLQLIAFGLNERRATSLFQEIALFVSSNGLFCTTKKKKHVFFLLLL
ncbi:MAG: hypothetical protein BYD32DRAFT_102311 [Podila humilis]|nr:MAG: hypothetical protein BYD32DRAFT_102311 [Podila humilis]